MLTVELNKCHVVNNQGKLLGYSEPLAPDKVRDLNQIISKTHSNFKIQELYCEKNTRFWELSGLGLESWLWTIQLSVSEVQLLHLYNGKAAATHSGREAGIIHEVPVPYLASSRRSSSVSLPSPLHISQFHKAISESVCSYNNSPPPILWISNVFSLPLPCSTV